jgi:hypothetical protein
MHPWLVFCKFIYELFCRYKISKISDRIEKIILFIAHLCSETADFCVLLYCLLRYFKVNCTNYSWNKAIDTTCSHWYEWMNRTSGNNACCTNRTPNHRVTCLVALLAVRISYWCGLASMYSVLLLLFWENFMYLYCLRNNPVLYKKDTFHSTPSLDPSLSINQQKAVHPAPCRCGTYS